MISEMQEIIMIQKSVSGMDEDANNILTWDDYYRCHAYVNNMFGKEFWAAVQTNSQTDVFFMIRYCSEVAELDTDNYRIIFREQIYNITFVDNIKYENKTLKVRATLQKEGTDAYSID